MYSTVSSFVLGFHGCDKTVAEGIFSGHSKHLLASQNQYDWLGHGIYFWENSPDRALDYARQQMSRKVGQKAIKDPAVIGADQPCPNQLI